MKFKRNEPVKHTRYGLAKVIRMVIDEDKKGNRSEGVLLNLLEDEGKALFYKDRNGELPRCYENDFKLIEKLS